MGDAGNPILLRLAVRTRTFPRVSKLYWDCYRSQDNVWSRKRSRIIGCYISLHDFSLFSDAHEKGSNSCEITHNSFAIHAYLTLQYRWRLASLSKPPPFQQIQHICLYIISIDVTCIFSILFYLCLFVSAICLPISVCLFTHTHSHNFVNRPDGANI